EDGWRRLDALGAYLDERLVPVLAKSPVPATLVRVGSMFWIAWFTKSTPRSAATLDPHTGRFYAPLFHALLEQGVAIAPSAFEIGFLSLAHERADVDRLADALAGALARTAAR